MDERINEILSRLDGVSQRGDGWIARCPSHDDSTPSLSLTSRDDGTVLLKCHAGCDAAAIVEALGLSWSDLFPSGEGISNSCTSSNPQLGPKSVNRSGGNSRIVACYNYQNDEGELLYQVVRY